MQKQQRTSLRKNKIIALFSFLGIFGIVIGSAIMALPGRSDDVITLRLDHSTQEFAVFIEVGFDRYVSILDGTKAFFDADESVDRKKFHAYMEDLDLKDRYLAFSSISYIEAVTAEEKEAFITEVRTDAALNGVGYPDFSIKPVGERDEYFVVKYTEPFVEKGASFGYDVKMNPEQRTAMERARDTGTPIVSESLVFSEEKSAPLGFAIFFPLYKQGVPINTIEERREAFMGSLAGAFTATEFYTEIFRRHNISPGIAFEVQDLNEGAARKKLFSWGNLPPSEGAPGWVNLPRPLSAAGGRWTLVVFGNKSEMLSPMENAMPLLLFALGTIADALLVGTIYFLADGRTRARLLAEIMTEKFRIKEAQMDAFLSNSPSIVFLKDATGKYIVANKAFEQLANKSFEEIIGKDDFDIFPLEVANAAQVNDKRVMSGLVPIEFEEHVSIDGNARVFLSVRFPLIDLNGMKYGTGGILSDITDRKKSQDELEERTSELERMNKLMIGREMMMIKLKETIAKQNGGL